MTTVVNIRHSTAWDVYIGRGSILGNPYTHLPLENTKAKFQVETREESIASFRSYAIERIKQDPKFAAAIKACHGRRLGCYCKPLSCHGDVIAELAEKMVKGEELQ